MKWVLLFLLCLPLVLGANDPGHDTLYVLKLGDSNITGTINLTGNVTASLVEATGRFFGPNIDIRGDGTSSGANNQLIGTSTGLELSSTGDLILNKAVTGGMAYIGWSGTATSLNVSGVIYEQDVRVCLQNGTNCPAGAAESGNVTGSGTTNYVPKWISSTELGDSVLFDDGANVGIGTTSPSRTLTVNSSEAVVALITSVNNSFGAFLDVQSETNNDSAIRFLNGSGQVKWTVGADNENSGVFGISASAGMANSRRLTILTDGNVGIADTTPGEKLDVTGNINATGDVCITGGQCLSTVSGSAGGWTDGGDTVSLTTAADNVSANTFFVDNTNGRVGIGTTSPGAKLEIREDETATASNTKTDISYSAITIDTDYTANNFMPGIVWNTADNNDGKPKAGIWVNETGVGTYMHLGTSSNYATGITNDGIVIDTTGDVGIGITRPSGALQVAGDEVRIGDAGTPGQATADGDLYVEDSIEYDGTLYAPGADLAENVPTSEPVEAGMVVELDKENHGAIKRTTDKYSMLIAGVISSDPALILNKNEEGAPLALTGRVPVRVNEENGPIEIGEYLVSSSTPGEAMGCSLKEINLEASEANRWQTIKKNERCKNAAFAKAMTTAHDGIVTGLVLLN